ncbi:hypothetical protein ES703_33561 [subsurface metagenome]
MKQLFNVGAAREKGRETLRKGGDINGGYREG